MDYYHLLISLNQKTNDYKAKLYLVVALVGDGKESRITTVGITSEKITDSFTVTVSLGQYLSMYRSRK